MIPRPAAVKADLKQLWQGFPINSNDRGAFTASYGVSPGNTGARLLRAAAACLGASWRWFERKRTQQLSSRRLRLTETISLGEKRSVSIVQVNNVQYLIGHCAGSVQLLARIDQQIEPQTEPQINSQATTNQKDFAEALRAASSERAS